MTEPVFYERREAGFESFPAENYVDYMTNVMPIPEKHLFYLPNRRKMIICEFRVDEIRGKYSVWWVEEFDKVINGSGFTVDSRKIDVILSVLIEGEVSFSCGICEEILGNYLKF